MAIEGFALEQSTAAVQRVAVTSFLAYAIANSVGLALRSGERFHIAVIERDDRIVAFANLWLGPDATCPSISCAICHA